MLRGREGNQRHLPHYLEAKSAKGLQREIIKLQRKEKSEFRFINFYYDAQKKVHVAWYYNEINTQDEIKELVNGLTTE